MSTLESQLAHLVRPIHKWTPPFFPSYHWPLHVILTVRFCTPLFFFSPCTERLFLGIKKWQTYVGGPHRISLENGEMTHSVFSVVCGMSCPSPNISLILCGHVGLHHMHLDECQRKPLGIIWVILTASSSLDQCHFLSTNGLAHMSMFGRLRCHVIGGPVHYSSMGPGCNELGPNISFSIKLI